MTELIEQVEQSTAGDLDLAAWLIEDIVLAIRRTRDPGMLLSVLLQGIVSIIQERLSVLHRRDAAISLCGVLWDRLNRDRD